MSNFLCDMKEGRGDQLPGAVRRLHPAAAFARYHLHRHRHRHRAFPLHAALAAGRSGSSSGEATLAAVRQPDGRGHLLPRRVSGPCRPARELSLSANPQPRRSRMAGSARIRPGTRAGIVQGRTDMHAYICGLDKMIKANRELLKESGLGPEIDPVREVRLALGWSSRPGALAFRRLWPNLNATVKAQRSRAKERRARAPAPHADKMPVSILRFPASKP